VLSAAAVIPSFFVVSVLPDEHRYIQGDSFREPELIITNDSNFPIEAKLDKTGLFTTLNQCRVARFMPLAIYIAVILLLFT
jgi:hypothetical protein